MINFSELQTVANLDDVEDDREMTTFAIQAAGFVPITMPPMPNVDKALGWMKLNAQALVSDHNLRWGNAAPFSGAELARRCNNEGIPAVLVTGYVSDTLTSIREHRRGVPEVVLRAELDGDRLSHALEAVCDELGTGPPKRREPRRALVRVDRVNPGTQQIDVVISQWDPRIKVSLPARMLGPHNLPDNLEALIDRRFFAIVNTGAEAEQELYFDQFEEAPDEPDEDALL